jgi:hypothetical protein
VVPLDDGWLPLWARAPAYTQGLLEPCLLQLELDDLVRNLLPADGDDHIIGLVVEQQLSPVDLLGLLRDIVPDERRVLPSQSFQVLQPCPQVVVLKPHLV